jgi:hypothetical protein
VHRLYEASAEPRSSSEVYCRKEYSKDNTKRSLHNYSDIRLMQAAPLPLSGQAIHDAIDEVCQSAKTSRDSWTLRRARGVDFAKAAASTSSLLFGILASDADGSSLRTILTTFYLAYSTWDGRVLYIDQCGFDEPVEQSLLIYRTLAHVAVKLGCSRYCTK